MAENRFAIVDPAAGISGDMLLGALVAVGLPDAWAEALPGRLGIRDLHVSVARARRCGLEAVQVRVELPGGQHEHPALEVGAASPRAHAHGRGHGHEPATAHDHSHAGHLLHAHAHGDHPHRHVAELIRIIEAAEFSSSVKERAVGAFRLLADAEARVHGVPAEDVALHEVGALDALVDIVGAMDGFERLGVGRVHVLPLALGTGWVTAAHGTMSVPAPATALLVEGLEIGPNGPVTGEATTPTGAVLLRTLGEGPPPPRWRGCRTGWGAGGRDPAGYSNVLRLVVAEAAPEAGQVFTVVTDVDDLSPEYLPPLREALADAGAVDVQAWVTIAKKDRPGFRIEALVPVDGLERVRDAFFRHSPTAGLRWWPAERVTLPREVVEVAVGGERVRAKVLAGPDGPRIKAEYDDVVAAAKRLGRAPRDVANDVHDAVRRRLGAATTATKEQ
ncbi:MAG TPA: nickel insertion protein [Gemmatimonadales bacterium]|nr:nickel insertion protein [Gemmatimonadales bacterium]